MKIKFIIKKIFNIDLLKQILSRNFPSVIMGNIKYLLITFRYEQKVKKFLERNPAVSQEKFWDFRSDFYLGQYSSEISSDNSFIRTVSNFIKKWNSKNVLEVGCGIGNAIKPLIRAFPNSNFVGLDISSKMINKAKENLWEFKNVEFYVNDLTQELKFNKNQFSITFSRLTLQHVLPKHIDYVRNQLINITKDVIVLFERFHKDLPINSKIPIEWIDKFGIYNYDHFSYFREKGFKTEIIRAKNSIHATTIVYLNQEINQKLD